MSFLFEACVDSVASASQALEGGAKRLELCEALVEGGLTPSLGKIRAVVKAAAEDFVPVHVLIRPRAGDFLYTEEERAVMVEDIHTAIIEGSAGGIVVGALTEDGAVDLEAMRVFIAETKRAGGACGWDCAVTFHRAIDVCRDPIEAVEQLSTLGDGIHYILTSGCMPTALEGAATIKRMRERLKELGSPIKIIAGGGVTPANAKEIVRLTGVEQLHGTARATVDSGMRYRRGAQGAASTSGSSSSPPVVFMGSERLNTVEAEWSHKICSKSAVEAIVAEGKEALKGGGRM